MFGVYKSFKIISCYHHHFTLRRYEALRPNAAFIAALKYFLIITNFVSLVKVNVAA